MRDRMNWLIFLLVVILVLVIIAIFTAIGLKMYQFKTAIDQRQAEIAQRRLFAETDAKVNLMKSAHGIEAGGYHYIVYGVDSDNRVLYEPIAGAPRPGVDLMVEDAKQARLRGLAVQFVMWTIDKRGGGSTRLLTSEELRERGWGSETLQEARGYLKKYNIIAQQGMGTVLREPWDTAGKLLVALTAEVIPPSPVAVGQGDKAAQE